MSKRDDLIAANPHLTPNDGKQDPLILGAKNLRADLAHAGITASVKSSRFAGGDSLHINVLDPEQVKQANEIADRYQDRGFDGMTDMSYSIASDWTSTFGSASYTFAQEAHREAREKLLGTYIAPAKKELSEAEIRKKFLTGAERGTQSTVARYVDVMKDNPEAMELAWNLATRNVAGTGGGTDAIRVLVEQGGMDPNTPTQNIYLEKTALHLSVGAGDNQLTKVLVEHGADIHAADGEGKRPLHYAALKNIEAVEILLNAGAQTNVQDKNGQTPLGSAAASRADLGVIEALLDKGADPNLARKDGKTPLFYAYTPEVAQALISAGGDPSLKNAEGQIAEDWTIRPGGNAVLPDEVKSVYRQHRLGQIAQDSRPQDDDLADVEEVQARQTRGRFM